MTSKKENKVVLVTGAARRIGAEITKLFHQHGYSVALHYNRSSEEAEALAHTLNAERENSAFCYQADLNSVSSIQAMAEKVANHFGKLDVLVNNASSFYPTAFGNVTEKDWDDLINSNVKGAFFLSQSLYPQLKQQQGSIINIVDIHAEKGLKSYPVYSIAKAGLAMMTKSLAKDLGPDVRVNGVSPGAILWPEHETLYEEQEKDILERVPLSRTGEPADIAKTVWFLAEQAPYISGQIIAVDGGRSLNC